MNHGTLERLDSFPYRHRLVDVMTSPVVLVPPDRSLADAARIMDERGISSVLVEDGAPGCAVGIVTERDVLRAMSRHGRDALELRVSDVMGGPLACVEADAYVYRAIGRMDRLGVRHLPVTDGQGRVVGIVTARGLLRQRAGKALALGDEVTVADGADALGAVFRSLPDLARRLLAEGVNALDVAGVISSVMRDMTARAGHLAEAMLAVEGRGAAPARWCLLVLGSAGRGESLLAPDQDNALVHAGSADDDPWFAAFGTRVAALLNAAGIPYCKGGIMASNAAWRHDEAGWRRLVEGWIGVPEGQHLLNVDVFFDFVPVAGDRTLAEGLRRDALDLASRSRAFLKNLSTEVEGHQPPIGFFGRFRMENGRIDLKKGGLWPLVAGARALALRHRVGATSTAERLAALAAAGRFNASDVAALGELQQLVTALILDQQLADLAAGQAPGTKVEIARLDRPTRRRLQRALSTAASVPTLVRDNMWRD